MASGSFGFKRLEGVPKAGRLRKQILMVSSLIVSIGAVTLGLALPSGARAGVVKVVHDDFATFAMPSRLALATQFSQPIIVNSVEPSSFYASSFDFSRDLAIPAIIDAAGSHDLWQGGYVGVQTTGLLDQKTVSDRTAIFSIWSATQFIAGDNAICDTWADAANSGEGGYGVSCRMPLDWNVKSQLSVEMKSTATGYGPDRNSQSHAVTSGTASRVVGTWWTAWVSVNSVKTRIADIFVPGVAHRISTLSNFVEMFGRTDKCKAGDYYSSATFGLPTFEGRASRGLLPTSGKADPVCDLNSFWNSDSSVTIEIDGRKRDGAAPVDNQVAQSVPETTAVTTTGDASNVVETPLVTPNEPVEVTPQGESTSINSGTIDSGLPKFNVKSGVSLTFNCSGLRPKTGNVEVDLNSKVLTSQSVNENGSVTLTFNAPSSGILTASLVGANGERFVIRRVELILQN